MRTLSLVEVEQVSGACKSNRVKYPCSSTGNRPISRPPERPQYYPNITININININNVAICI